jgi:hypothetical protein
MFSRWAKGAVKPGGMCCTIRIGTARSRGKRGKISCKALGPPVEVPRATIADTEGKAELQFSDWHERAGFLDKASTVIEFCDCAAALILAMSSSLIWRASSEVGESCLGT